MAELLLDHDLWDLCVNANGQIAICEEPYALAQRAANEIKLFIGEGWYDTNQGLPHFNQELGRPLNMAAVKIMIENAALGVEGIIQATAYPAIDRKTRKLTGSVLLKSQSGEAINVRF